MSLRALWKHRVETKRQKRYRTSKKLRFENAHVSFKFGDVELTEIADIEILGAGSYYEDEDS